MTTLLSVIALTGVGCGDDDTVTPPTGGSGGSAGRGGSAGTAGTGGSAGGTAGTGGSTAGTGGSTAGTGGSTAGTGGSTAGTGGSTVEIPDGGVDGGDGGGEDPFPTATNRQEAAEGICAHFDAIPGDCETPENCVDGQLEGMTFFDSLVPDCTETVTALFICYANSPQSDYVCSEGQGATAEGICDEEQAAFDEATGDANCNGS